MKLSSNRSKIVGVQLGELRLNFIWPGSAPVVATFGLLDEEGSARGRFDMTSGWSPTTHEAIANLVSALEEDALRLMFDEPDSENPSKTPQTQEEPSQF